MLQESRRVAVVLALSIACAAPPVLAKDAVPSSAAHDQAVQKVLSSEAYKKALTVLDEQHGRIVEDGITLTEIPAPPFKEAKRAQAFAELLRASGLKDVTLDEEGNVLGLRPGTAGGDQVVVVSAHMDTVFPEGTDVKVKRDGTRLAAPGIGDDTMSLAVLAGYVRAMDAAGIRTRDNILFVGTVGEEGPGDLRGVRYLFTKGKYQGKIKAFYSVESGSVARVTHGGVGSKRYRATFQGPGGHSFGAFGLVNPMYALGQAATAFSTISVPAHPKTTYSIGRLGGGTSVNSIPVEAWMEVDMRSEDVDALKRVEDRFLTIVKEAVATENFARSTKEGEIKLKLDPIGDRPAGTTAVDTDIVQYAISAIKAGGYEPNLNRSSTDSNLPMSLGVPAITVGRMAPGTFGRSHALDEWLDSEKGPMVKAMGTTLSTILVTTGMQ